MVTHGRTDERDKGFTLIELLVVIVIIGILAAIAVPVFLNQRKKAVHASMKSDAKAAVLALETHAVNNPDWMSWSPWVEVTAITPDYKASPGNLVRLTGNEAGVPGLWHLPTAQGYCVIVENNNLDYPNNLVTFNPVTGQFLNYHDAAERAQCDPTPA